MKTNELITGLRACRSGLPGHCKNCPVYNQDSGCLGRLHTVAADTLETQQKRIEELERELRCASLCYTCARNGTKCHADAPVNEPDVCCGDYEWRGATGDNVGGKEVDAKPLTAFLAPIDAYQGLKRKFLVFKSDTGEMVENCFVLRPDKDPAAVEALRVYAGATDNAALSADILNWVGVGEQAECRWIPVTERLPEYSDGHVLVTDGDRVKISCRNACYKTASGDIRCAQEYGSGMPVTHWMPLPEPPKEVS